MQRPEVLAPAGDREAMRAAVLAGADAVYFGIHGFNARARATNFDPGELRDTLQYLHAHEVRGYVTLNTLVFDSELPALERAVIACADAGVDAVIVQDVGVLRLVRAVAPTLHVHASTQMTCTDAGSVRFAADLGASRVILARELSIADIASIRAEAPEIELEVFVHGALCIAYSGQCLTSEAIGGRSANRGACAQACRLPYELVVDGVLRELGDHAYLLSPEDLEASKLVPELMRLGICSLKIEGRLKGPAYVAAATTLYRRAIDLAMKGADDHADISELRRDALQAYSRGSGPGFLGGIDHQRLVEGQSCDHRGLEVGICEGVRRVRGRDWIRVKSEEPITRGDGLLVEGGRAAQGELGGRVWEVEGDLVWLGPDNVIPRELSLAGRRVWKTSDPARERAVLTRIDRSPHRIALDLRVEGAIGEPLKLIGRSERGQRATVVLDEPLTAASKRPIDEAVLREQLGRLGDTPYFLRDIEIAIEGKVYIAVSSLNRARRALCESLVARKVHETTSATLTKLAKTAILPQRPTPREGLFVLCRTLPQAEAALEGGADGIILDFLELTGTGDAVRALRARSSAHLTLAPPRIRKPGEEKIDRFLASLGPDAILVRGLGALADASHADDSIERVGDFSLNIANRISATMALEHGLSAFTPSFDLDAQQLLALLDPALAPFAEIVLHHPMPLFHMEHCVIAGLLSEGRDHKTCGRPCERHQVSLRDRAGLDHPVEADVGCRNTVFHARAQSAADLVPRLRERGVRRFRVELVREAPSEVLSILRTYRGLVSGTTSPKEALRELRAESGVGVVKGSLRVLRDFHGA